MLFLGLSSLSSVDSIVAREEGKRSEDPILAGLCHVEAVPVVRKSDAARMSKSLGEDLANLIKFGAHAGSDEVNMFQLA